MVSQENEVSLTMKITESSTSLQSDFVTLLERHCGRLCRDRNHEPIGKAPYLDFFRCHLFFIPGAKVISVRPTHGAGWVDELFADAKHEDVTIHVFTPSVMDSVKAFAVDWERLSSCAATIVREF